MYPDVNIEGNTSKNLKILINEFLEIKFSNNKRIFQIRYKKNPKKINFIFSSNSKKERYLFYRDQKIKIEDLGLEFGLDDQGTGYHYPKGILLSKGNHNKAIFGKEKIIDTKNIYKIIIRFFKIRK